MILNRESNRANSFETSSFVTITQLLKILNDNEFEEQLINIYEVELNSSSVIKIGNAKQLLSSINILDKQCEKVDIVTKLKYIHLQKLFEKEKAFFEILNIKDPTILKKNDNSDLLVVETCYNAKVDILDHYHFSKFANYCRDFQYNDLIDDIERYLRKKNKENNETIKLRLLYKQEEEKYYLRAATSELYQNFGINFSVFVALISLNKYVEETKNEIFINRYVIDDSYVYISFALKDTHKINSKLSLSFNLILENDEVKKNPVSFNGIFKLTATEKNGRSEIYLKPRGLRTDQINYPTDLLTYNHRGSVDNVFERIQDLPKLIKYFIEQAKEDAERIDRIKSPDDVRKHIIRSIKFSRKAEFQVYKSAVRQKLASITVDNTFKLFELLRTVEDLFEHDDVISRDFWREKLYESLVKKK